MFDWITSFVESGGYAGIAFLMFAENLFPPIPSELIMPLAGYTAAKGELSILGVILSGTFGTLAGALVWYYIGLRLGLERLRRLARRHGRWLTVDEDGIDRARAWFDRHGRMALVLGHLVPAVRTLISVPAGVSRMAIAPFLLASAAGTFLWTTILAAGGYLLEQQYQRVESFANPVTNAILALMLAWYVYRVVTWPRSHPGTGGSDAGAGNSHADGSNPHAGAAGSTSRTRGSKSPTGRQ